MFSFNRKTRTRLLQLCDASLFVLAFTLVYFVRATFPFWNLPVLQPFRDYLILIPVLAFLGPASLSSQGFYRELHLTARSQALFAALRSIFIVGLILITLLFLLRVQYARSVILLACPLAGILVCIRHEIFVRLLSSPMARRQWRQRILWVGDQQENAKIRDALRPAEVDQLETVGEYDPRDPNAGPIAQLLHAHSVNTVIINLARLNHEQTLPILLACEREGVPVIVRHALLSHSPLSLSIEWFGGEPVLYYRAQKAPPVQLAIKQLIDYFGALILILFLSPLLAGIALLIKITSPGPVLFRQTRSGLNGHPFQLMKFRSMRTGAEAEQHTLAPFNEMTGPAFKVKNDPRVTGFGRLLRKHSLDELPQLYNVLRGEMSLVGPRPLPVKETGNLSDDAHRRRLSVKPGLTCLWQIHGRNDIKDFNEWIRLDLSYIDNWSLWLDLKIIFATIPVILLGKGAS